MDAPTIVVLVEPGQETQVLADAPCVLRVRDGELLRTADLTPTKRDRLQVMLADAAYQVSMIQEERDPGLPNCATFRAASGSSTVELRTLK